VFLILFSCFIPFPARTTVVFAGSERISTWSAQRQAPKMTMQPQGIADVTKTELRLIAAAHENYILL
jgi:hypothetical protein